MGRRSWLVASFLLGCASSASEVTPGGLSNEEPTTTASAGPTGGGSETDAGSSTSGGSEDPSGSQTGTGPDPGTTSGLVGTTTGLVETTAGDGSTGEAPTGSTGEPSQDTDEPPPVGHDCDASELPAMPPPICSMMGADLQVEFINGCAQSPVEILWINPACVESSVTVLAPGQSTILDSRVGRTYRIRDAEDGRILLEVPPLQEGQTSVQIP